MNDNYDFFPITLDPPFESQDFSWFEPQDLSDCADSVWSRAWLAGQYDNDKMLDDIFSIGNPDVSAFASEFLRSYKFFRVVRLKQAYRNSFQPHTWVSFIRSTARQKACQSLAEVAGALPGDFCYMPDRSIQRQYTSSKYDTVNLFFEMFGGLRDSFPVLGGDYFPPRPRRKERKFFSARDVLQNRWLDASTIYVRGNCDYFLLAMDGAVGYMPIEGERRIAKIADCFADFLIYWVNDDRRKYYDNRLEMICAERSGRPFT